MYLSLLIVFSIFLNCIPISNYIPVEYLHIIITFNVTKNSHEDRDHPVYKASYIFNFARDQSSALLPFIEAGKCVFILISLPLIRDEGLFFGTRLCSAGMWWLSLLS